jgi:putative CocE/NonD family hydrolase
MKKINCLALLLLLTGYLPAQERSTFRIKDFYNKMDTLIPMRDGVKLYTVIYTPKNDSALYPVLMERTPYSVSPYGSNNFGYQPAPNTDLLREGYILVLQDVRGRFMSEGKNLEVTPHIANKKSSKEVDESSDTYDTVDWLLKNIKNNNGRVGLYGISYPGFYATACLPGAHPAIKAVSPQAPIADEFMGDDANHNGAFFLLDNFNFMNNFGKERTEPVKDYGNNIFNAKIKDAYQFFLKLGPVKNTNSSNYFDNQSEIWNEYLSHDTYDAYWKARNIRPHLKDIRIPVMVVGGWYDAEDLFGALQTYKAIEKQSKVNNNRIVMGPWTHGGWATGNWTKFATQSFGSNTSKYFQDSLETAFFNFYLKDKGNFAAAEATMFETGSNQWKHYTAWPPAETKPTAYYFAAGGKLGEQKPGDLKSSSEYISDPAKPVFGIADIDVDEVLGFLHDVGELFAFGEIAASGHVLHEGVDVVFHVLIDQVGLFRVGPDEVDLIDDGLEVFADEVAGGARLAFVLLHGFIEFVEKTDEIVDEGHERDAAIHDFVGFPKILHLSDVELLIVAVVDDAEDHVIDVLVDRHHAFVDGKVLIVVDP